MPYLLLLGFKSWAPALIGKQGSLLFLCLKFHLHNASRMPNFSHEFWLTDSYQGSCPCAQVWLFPTISCACVWLYIYMYLNPQCQHSPLFTGTFFLCWDVGCLAGSLLVSILPESSFALPSHHVWLLAPRRGPPWCGWITFQANWIVPYFVQVRMAKHRLIRKIMFTT